MLEFDVRTALLIIGLLYVLMPVITWIVLAGQRSHAVLLWCLGGLMMAAAAFLTAAQGMIPDWLFLIVSPLTFHAASLLRIQSLRLDLGIPWKPAKLVLALFVIVGVINAIYYGSGDASLRAQSTSLIGAILIFHLAMLAWRIGRDESSPSARWIARVYFLVAAIVFYRVLALIDFTGSVGVATEGFSSKLIVVVILVASVLGHFAYVGMHLDRSMRRELKATADRARDEESHRLGGQIAQLDRQRSLGEMSASLGHELNQPLTAILTNAQVARRGLQTAHFSAEQHGEFLDKIIQNTQRASQIIERIRGFIRPSVARSEPVDLVQIVHEVFDLVADEARAHGVNFVFPEKTSALKVSGDPIQLSQIVLNVFCNAVQALKNVPRRNVEIALGQVDGRAVLSIRDSGPGLSPEALARIGTPFFTTKPGGLGMGISISRSIAVQHGGTLNIDNAAGGGVRVELSLPLLPEGCP